MSVVIEGVGTATPVRIVEQSVTETFARARAPHTRLLASLYGASGIEARGFVLVDDAPAGTTADRALGAFYADGSEPTTAERMRVFARLAPPLAERAARSALDDAGLLPESITHLVLASCTGFVAPGVDHALIDRLPLPVGVSRLLIGFMGCHAALNALQGAAAVAIADARARVLVVCVELCSLHLQTGETRGDHVVNALFADGAGAVVIRGAGAADPGTPRVAGSTSLVVPGTADEMRWEVGDRGFRMVLTRRVPSLLARAVPPWLLPWLAGHGYRVDDIGAWAIHAGGPRIVTAVADGLGLDEARVASGREVLREHGNMSSATVLFALERLRRAEAPRPWVMLSFGPGLSAEAALVV